MIDFIPTAPHHLRYIPPDAIPRMCADTRGITAISEQGPQAIAMFDTWSPNSCQMHIWIGSPMVIRRGFLQEVFGFVFGSGRTVAIGSTPSDNEKALKFNKHIGFREIFRIPDAFDIGIDAVVVTMTKSECRWIDHGQQIKQSA